MNLATTCVLYFILGYFIGQRVAETVADWREFHKRKDDNDD